MNKVDSKECLHRHPMKAMAAKCNLGKQKASGYNVMVLVKFSCQGLSICFFSFSLIFTLWSTGTANSIMRHYYFTLLRVSHTSVSWWFFTAVRVTASLLKFVELFSVFWPISTILLFGQSPLVLLFPSPPVHLGTIPSAPSAPITLSITVTFMFHSFFPSSFSSSSIYHYCLVYNKNNLSGHIFLTKCIFSIVWC